MTSKTPITLYGNVGNDPETRTIPGKQVTKQFYDPIIDDMVEREFTTPEREVRTFSIAVSKKDPEGNDVTRWISGFKTTGALRKAKLEGRIAPVGRRGGTGTWMWSRDDLDRFLRGEEAATVRSERSGAPHGGTREQEMDHALEEPRRGDEAPECLGEEGGRTPRPRSCDRSHDGTDEGDQESHAGRRRGGGVHVAGGREGADPRRRGAGPRRRRARGRVAGQELRPRSQGARRPRGDGCDLLPPGPDPPAGRGGEVARLGDFDRQRRIGRTALDLRLGWNHGKNKEQDKHSTHGNLRMRDSQGVCQLKTAVPPRTADAITWALRPLRASGNMPRPAGSPVTDG